MSREFIPNDPSTSGPTIPQGWRECQCGRYCDPNMAKRCHGKDCETLICTTCQEDGFFCIHCGDPFCVDHSRPNIEGKGRICAGCDYVFWWSGIGER